MIPNATHEEILYVCQNLRDVSRNEIFLATDATEAEFAAAIANAPGFKWVGYHDGLPAAILGARPAHEGVWIVYGFGTDHWIDIWRDVTRTALKHLIPDVKATGAHRAHSVTLTSATDIHRWLRLLGATEECVMSGYGKGQEDFTMFAWHQEVSDVRLSKR